MYCQVTFSTFYLTVFFIYYIDAIPDFNRLTIFILYSSIIYIMKRGNLK